MFHLKETSLKSEQVHHDYCTFRNHSGDGFKGRSLSAANLLSRVERTAGRAPEGGDGTSRRWDRGLGHSQLLSQIVETSNVVHAALAHHAGQLSVHLHTRAKNSSYNRTKPTHHIPSVTTSIWVFK